MESLAENSKKRIPTLGSLRLFGRPGLPAVDGQFTVDAATEEERFQETLLRVRGGIQIAVRVGDVGETIVLDGGRVAGVLAKEGAGDSVEVTGGPQ